jgi:signal transduction histidine kinase
MPTVAGDPIQLVQLFQNLVGNAIKFRREVDPVVRVRAVGGDGSWQFSVEDNGIGIEASHFDRIFQVFERLHGKEYPGTGIGLALCKKIVERHGGRIWLESALGQGTTFFFTLLLGPLCAPGKLELQQTVPGCEIGRGYPPGEVVNHAEQDENARLRRLRTLPEGPRG